MEPYGNHLFAVTFRDGNHQVRCIVTGSTPNDARERASALIEKQGLGWKTVSEEPQPISAAYFVSNTGTLITEEATTAARV